MIKDLKITGGDIPVIVVTAFANKELAIDSINNHVFSFIEKPFNKDRFLSSLLKAIQYLGKMNKGDIYALTEIKIIH